MVFHSVPVMTFSKIFPAAFISLIMFSACTQGDFKDTGKSVFRYNESAGLTSLDPAFARDQANIWATNQIFNGLVQLDENLKVKPCIAKNWEISGDGLIYTFHLRTDVLFHTDTAFGIDKTRKVIASDFVYSFNRLTDEKLASPGAWVLEKVSKGSNAFFAPNDSTFVIRLSSPFPPFL